MVYWVTARVSVYSHGIVVTHKHFAFITCIAKFCCSLVVWYQSSITVGTDVLFRALVDHAFHTCRML